MVDIDKVRVINGMQSPRQITELRRFLGKMGYHRRFIKGYASIAKPLTELLRKENTYDWTNACEESFRRMKEALKKAPILATPNWSQEFHVQVDASNIAIGCVLT